ncbi:Polygalacturonase [Dendrobium catenatum]|uniref:Polygalacturonase n=1 Tax=Dendrobium catenatum TaxID=906689 RepID=A0A2I0WTG4_9ASPA|nr:Polygalacturonase [Dendrobium catenatum]
MNGGISPTNLTRADGMSLQGGGLIDGRGHEWWDLPYKPHKGINGVTSTGNCDSPVTLNFYSWTSFPFPEPENHAENKDELQHLSKTSNLQTKSSESTSNISDKIRTEIRIRN